MAAYSQIHPDRGPNSHARNCALYNKMGTEDSNGRPWPPQLEVIHGLTPNRNMGSQAIERCLPS